MITTSLKIITSYCVLCPVISNSFLSSRNYINGYLAAFSEPSDKSNNGGRSNKNTEIILELGALFNVLRRNLSLNTFKYRWLTQPFFNIFYCLTFLGHNKILDELQYEIEGKKSRA